MTGGEGERRHTCVKWRDLSRIGFPKVLALIEGPLRGAPFVDVGIFSVRHYARISSMILQSLLWKKSMKCPKCLGLKMKEKQSINEVIYVLENG